ncbi:proteophosphoglycan ppg4 [Rhodotorula toruloides]|uniref:Proteophosphoglycan ppg4 n=1 Tax=Rhodotorula toruloides TaxID=5286 RepID=A0A511KNH5_RHOTO|nr:proteophosphoglycan ppg4 [Rhodotorula toruloides]
MAYYQPLETDTPARPQKRRLSSRPLVIGAAVLLLLLLLLGSSHEPSRQAVSTGLAKAKEYGSALNGWAKEFEASYGPKGKGWLRVEEQYALPTREALRHIVSDEPQYLVKDGWATYGYNNGRYMLEATLLMAKIAGRIPVIPDSVWARSCATDKATCAEHALRYFEHRNEHEDAVGAKWNDDGAAYKLGIENFLDIPHLRKTYGPLLTYTEYLHLYSIDPALYDESLRWNVTNYTPPGLSTATMSEQEFQDQTFVRVDRPPQVRSKDEMLADAPHLSTETVKRALEGKPAWSLAAARDALRRRGEDAVADDDSRFLWQLGEAGAVLLWTYSDEVLMNKAMARPSTEVALPASIRPLSTALSSPPYSNASIVYLSGNLHDQRKAGGVYFTSPSERDTYTQLVLSCIRAPPRVRRLGARLAEKMSARVEGRRWVAAHLRRGDFVGISWAPERDPVRHFERTREALERGKEVLRSHYGDDGRLPPSDDPFYLATDETNTTSLSYFRSRGALLLSDLLTPRDSALLGYPAAYTDVLAVVEQQVLASSDYFVGSEMSSTSGGAVNGRLAMGREEWSWGLLGREG